GGEAQGDEAGRGGRGGGRGCRDWRRRRGGSALMATKDAIAILKEKFGEKILEAVDTPSAPAKDKPGIFDLFVRIAPKDLVEVMTFCRDEPRLRFDMLSCLTAVDYPKESKFQIVYSLDSVPHNHWLTVKVDAPRDNPVVPTLENVYKTADWH